MSIVIYFPTKYVSDTDHVWKRYKHFMECVKLVVCIYRKYIEKKLNNIPLHPYSHVTVVYAYSVSKCVAVTVCC